MYGGNLYQPTRKTHAQNSSMMITAHELTLSTQSTRVKSSVGLYCLVDSEEWSCGFSTFPITETGFLLYSPNVTFSVLHKAEYQIFLRQCHTQNLLWLIYWPFLQHLGRTNALWADLFIGKTGDWTQCLRHARQELYRGAINPALLFYLNGGKLSGRTPNIKLILSLSRLFRTWGDTQV